MGGLSTAVGDPPVEGLTAAIVGRYGRREERCVVTDGMTIRLHLKRMKVVRVVEDEIDELVIEVADTRSVVRCPACGHKSSKVQETGRVVVQDVAFGRRRR